jgi:hypothetical protein
MGPIMAGEEITCDYKYSWDRAPDWYKECLERYLTVEKGIAKEKVREWTRSRERGDGTRERQ